ncbi:metal/formaldehyde-sensitive transcriptional repressor [Ciceribacter sp. L1K23]|uniref:metal/formaldehyde-sensitive transcriptional repressor n=1 Tax=Ciceribacter sp. L1K23 TaxID=2820276 RepID=UPI001B825AF2|nr:metal/formaldehyde-sensitive transcriptional repressor [Ciceribacter sp. L1K23]MBR0556507.1 metal/formaldehyde-sensitive transcriptional repressor [Ciceribacter sp. L1K23]
MSHLIKNKSKLSARVSRLQGQIEAVQRALDAEKPCGDILNLVASIRGAVNGLTVELIEEHIREHVSNPQTDPDLERARGAEDLIAAVRTYLK